MIPLFRSLCSVFLASLFLVFPIGSLHACAMDAQEYYAGRALFFVEGNDLHISGTLNTYSGLEFEEIYAAYPQINRLVLGTIGGSIDDDFTLEFGYRIRELGLATHLTSSSEIYSGGVDVFISGSQRTMEQGAIIGVHAWSEEEGAEAADFAKDDVVHDMYIAHAVDMLGREDFYWFTIDSAPAEGMHNMTAAEIAHFGLLTE